MLKEQDCAGANPEEPKKLPGKIRGWDTLVKLVTRTATLALVWAVINSGTASPAVNSPTRFFPPSNTASNRLTLPQLPITLAYAAEYLTDLSTLSTSAPQIYAQEKVGIYLLSKNGQPPTLSREDIENSLRRNLVGAAPSAFGYWNRYTDGALSDMPLQFYPETGFLEIDNNCSNSWFEGEVVDKATRISTDFNPTVMIAVADSNLGCGYRSWTVQNSWSVRPGIIIANAYDAGVSRGWNTLGHELGHVFGVRHLNSLTCSKEAVNLSNCASSEYASFEGVMGHTRFQPIGDLNRVQVFQLLNAFNQTDFNSPLRAKVREITSGGEYSVSCAPFRQGQPDIQLLKIPHIAFGDNNTDWVYWIGCRPLQPEPAYNLNLPASHKGGVSLYLTPQDNWDTPSGYPYYGDVNVISQQNGAVLHPGQVDRLIGSPLGSLKVLQIDNQSAVVQIGQNLRPGVTVFLPSLSK